jgi:hypothetical protein
MVGPRCVGVVSGSSATGEVRLAFLGERGQPFARILAAEEAAELVGHAFQVLDVDALE